MYRLDSINNYKGDDLLGTSNLSLPTYMVNQFLPRCALVYGDRLVSVYLNFLTYLCHDTVNYPQRLNHTWVSYYDIYENLNLPRRAIKRHIKTLESLGLISRRWDNRLGMWYFNHLDLSEASYTKVLGELEQRLLQHPNRYTPSELKVRFDELNLRKSSVNQRYIWPDVNAIRATLKQAEHAYPGASLLTLHLLRTPGNVSEQEWAITVGSSQPTVSRIIQALEDARLVTKVHTYLNDRQPTVKVQPTVLELVPTSIKFTCPLCQAEFDVKSTFGKHLKQGDEAHALLFDLRQQERCPVEELETLYNKYKGCFTLLDKRKRRLNQEYMKAEAPCKLSCEQCFTHWRKEEFIGCKYPRQEAFLNTVNKLRPRKTTPTVTQAEAQLAAFQQPKPSNEDKPIGLVRYFYNLINDQPINLGRDLRLMKLLLNSQTQPISADDVRYVLRYAARKHYNSLNLILRLAPDALLEKQLLAELQQPNTAANLVYRYYRYKNLEVDVNLLVSEARKVQEAIDSYGYELTTLAVLELANNRDDVLGYVVHRTGQKAKKREQQALNNTIEAKISQPKEQKPAVVNHWGPGGYGTKKNGYPWTWDEFLTGFVGINDFQLDKEEEERLQAALYEAYKNRTFTPTLSAMEWAMRTGLRYTVEMYQETGHEPHQKFGNSPVLRNWVFYLQQGKEIANPRSSGSFYELKLKEGKPYVGGR